MKLRFIRLTKIKILCAAILFKLVRLIFRKEKYLVNRDNINFELDLREGIDFSIFLFGSFQKKIFKNSIIDINKCSRIIDVGANIGSMSLNFAKFSSSDAKVLAIEPTDYALLKFKKNLELNPTLASKIILKNYLISSEQSMEEVEVFSSWRIDGGYSSKRHSVHGGTSFKVDFSKFKSLDEIVSDVGWDKVDLIKIDTDGNEWSVLNASREILEKSHPKLIVEFGRYAIKEKGHSLEDFINFFKQYSYQVFTLDGKRISWEIFNQDVPENHTKDYIFI